MEAQLADREPVLARHDGQVAERERQRRGVRVGVDEDEQSPRVDRDGAQAELAGLEARLEVAARRGAQGAVRRLSS
jgi:hypothetical protein